MCDDYWDELEARVVCRKLEHNEGSLMPKGSCSVHLETLVSIGHSIAVLRSKYGGFPGPIFLDDLLCDGNDSSLLDCSTGQGSHQCLDHSQDAGVRCSVASTCEEQSMRLVPRELSGDQLHLREGELEEFEFINDEIHRGRLEVCVGGEWWSICYDDSWSDEDATIACEKLDFSPFGEL